MLPTSLQMPVRESLKESCRNKPVAIYPAGMKLIILKFCSSKGMHTDNRVPYEYYEILEGFCKYNFPVFSCICRFDQSSY
jgi:hypothetical protein